MKVIFNNSSLHFVNANFKTEKPHSILEQAYYNPNGFITSVPSWEVVYYKIDPARLYLVEWDWEDAVLASTYVISTAHNDYLIGDLPEALVTFGQIGSYSKNGSIPAVTDVECYLMISKPKSRDITVTSYINPKEEIPYTSTDGSFIGSNGNISSNSSFFVSGLIPVTKGNVYAFYGRGYLTNVAMISTFIDDETIKHVEVTCADGTARLYCFRCKENGFIKLSGNKDTKGSLLRYEAE